ncbi:hypothetical protein SBD_4817 [Streptomyces bottropensis ATCC 25435]|jgi:hypothetical protein|uniref:Uncharacterized protein n=1 Tax=Streptomyces bottropensis ATCC 25435 TaxID=1054862 RepID=M3EVX6_9ACTN|nr:hypothetical protein SBD_4817 [Streptomyces bottropensis ATCC 25435]
MAPGHERSDDELQEAAMRNRRRSAPESRIGQFVDAAGNSTPLPL